MRTHTRVPSAIPYQSSWSLRAGNQKAPAFDCRLTWTKPCARKCAAMSSTAFLWKLGLCDGASVNISFMISRVSPWSAYPMRSKYAKTAVNGTRISRAVQNRNRMMRSMARGPLTAAGVPSDCNSVMTWRTVEAGQEPSRRLTEHGFHGMLLEPDRINPAPEYHCHSPPASRVIGLGAPLQANIERCSFVFSFVLCEHYVESDWVDLLAAVEGGDPGLDAAW
jgi:hypothetical protein